LGDGGKGRGDEGGEGREVNGVGSEGGGWVGGVVVG